jgi:nephrocystin-3
MATSGSTVIRVFLSSTFVDFQEERSLLVKQVFPSLRRRARSRGVEIVDVDLRWGVTADQTERGETLPLCLAEIDRCRPYFISLLGERYGWVPPADPTYYKPALLERQPWLKERMGGASLTELEILHGVLRNPEMAGHAFFYLRDPAYAQAQPEPGWVADNLQERQRLSALKEEVRRSGFPVSEGLTAPQAIAERIEADLWAVIEREHPEQEPQDPLQQEQQRHSDYRRARTGLYLGGETAITQLESWIEEGEQRILITGESGAGKSALIANWLEAHQKSAPQDLVHAHHLGCTNDASAVRPLLGRLIDTASLLLLEEEQIADPLKVPQDWWELVFKVGEVFALLSPLCQRQKRRWILVLDGLDRLAEDDKQALPWIPTTIPPGIHVVASALDCPARTILQERQYCSHEIGPLGKAEQQQLIERYLSRYTKQLESGLQQRILAHRLAGSPLFLKVLLEELRQCAWFDTLGEQLEFYLSTESIDWLYAKVLERLERDGHAEATRRSLTALWASRAGLSETELLEITGLAPLEWAPVDLALEEAFGRNGERLVFDHDYIRIAVQDRYLPCEDARRQEHSELADWFADRASWDERDSEELLWQIMKAEEIDDLQGWLKRPDLLAYIAKDQGAHEVIGYWLLAFPGTEQSMDETLHDATIDLLEGDKYDREELKSIIGSLSSLLQTAGCNGNLLINLRKFLINEIGEVGDQADSHIALAAKLDLATALRDFGRLNEAKLIYKEIVDHEKTAGGLPTRLGTSVLFGFGTILRAECRLDEAGKYLLQAKSLWEKGQGCNAHPQLISLLTELGSLHDQQGDHDEAFKYYDEDCQLGGEVLSKDHPLILRLTGLIGSNARMQGDVSTAIAVLEKAKKSAESLLGPQHPDTLEIYCNLANSYLQADRLSDAEALYCLDLNASSSTLGPRHPSTLISIHNLAYYYSVANNSNKAESLYREALSLRVDTMGVDHLETNETRWSLADILTEQCRFDESIPLRRQILHAAKECEGVDTPTTLKAMNSLAQDLYLVGSLDESETLYRKVLAKRTSILGSDHMSTMVSVYGLATCLSAKRLYSEAISLRRKELVWCSENNKVDPAIVLGSMHGLGCDLLANSQVEEALNFLSSCLDQRRELFGFSDDTTLATLAKVQEALSCLELHTQAALHAVLGDLKAAETIYSRCLALREKALGSEHPDTLRSVFELAIFLSSQERYAESIPLRRRELLWCTHQNGNSDPGSLISMHGLGCDLLAADQPEEALGLLQVCLQMRRELLGTCDEATIGTQARVMEALSNLGRQPEAIDLSVSLLHDLRQQYSENHPDVLLKLANQATLYEQLDQLDEAEKLWRHCLSGREAARGADHPVTLSTAWNLAEVLSALSRPEEAIPLRRRELAWCQEQNGAYDLGTLHSLNQLAIDLREVGDLEEAEALFRELLAARLQILDPADEDVARSLADLSETLEAAGRLEEACQYAEQTLQHRRQHEGADAWMTNRKRLDLARVLQKLGRDAEALPLLEQLQASLGNLDLPDEEDRHLLAYACDLLDLITAEH